MKDEIEDEINDFREELKNTPQEQALRAMALELMRSYPRTGFKISWLAAHEILFDERYDFDPKAAIKRARKLLKEYKRSITMKTISLNIELPVGIGEKIWIDDSKGFGSCNFLERYKELKEVTVTNVEVRYNVANKTTEIAYTVDNKTIYRYNGFIAHTKEEYYEKFREEIENLIPEDLRNYLWKNSKIC